VFPPHAYKKKGKSKPKFATDFLNKNLWKLKKESKNFKRIAYNLNNNLTIIYFYAANIRNVSA
jgi:hypothetical protein